jgi:predicted amidohydrolase
MIVFPETAISGYENDLRTNDRTKKMHAIVAETIPGPATDLISETTKKYGVYAVFGMPERDKEDSTIIYNSAPVFGPEGLIGVHRKVHLPKEEVYWAKRGNEPLVFDTPWGPVGVGICYDTYFFPELTRYARSKGARLFLNPTVVMRGDVPGDMCRITLEAQVIMNSMFIATSNIIGSGSRDFAIGGSSIIGPAARVSDITYYAGHPFHTPGSGEAGVYSATIDLAVCDIVSDWNLFRNNENVGTPDFRPDIYIELNKKTLNDPQWGE